MRHTTIRILVYFVLPTAICLGMGGMYFSVDITLQRIICPKLPPLPPNSWREFGLLEIVQKITLLFMSAVCLCAAWKKPTRIERGVWALLALFSAFVFLEEVDYGVHWYRYAMLEEHAGWFTPAADWDPALVAQIDTSLPNVNLHNRGLTDAFKFVGDAALVAFFLLVPWGWVIVGRTRRDRVPEAAGAWIDYVAADRFAVLGLFAMVLSRFVIHTLAAQGAGVLEIDGVREPGALESNLSEFREWMTYYIFAVYLFDIACLRVSPGAPLRPDTAKLP